MCGRVGIKRQEIQIEDTTLVEVGDSISPEKLGRECLRDGWIDITGQCANTLQYMSGIVGYVGKVRWSGVCMVNETLDMVGGCILIHVCL